VRIDSIRARFCIPSINQRCCALAIPAIDHPESAMMERNMFRLLRFFIACFMLPAFYAGACEQCKCQGCNSVEIHDSFSSSLTDAFKKGNQAEAAAPAPYKWYFDTLVEYVAYAHVNVARDKAIIDAGRDTHGHVHEYDVTQRFGYMVTQDLQLSIAQGYRALKMREIEDEDILGKVEHSNGPTDLDFGVQYCFLHQRPDASPVDLMVFADVKFPTGRTNNRKPTGELFETEDQPGTGSFNETIGLSTAKRWGKWSATAAYSFTHKGVGSQNFKEGDVNRLAITGTRKLTPDAWGWKLFLSQGVQGFIEDHARDHGIRSPDHGGHFIYAVPGITAQPNRHLYLTISGAVPIYQQENGFHQKDCFAIQFNAGIRF
jgi:hypothetical protein